MTRILGRFQLHDHTGEPLRKRIVNIARHSIAFSEHGSLPALPANSVS